MFLMADGKDTEKAHTQRVLVKDIHNSVEIWEFALGIKSSCLFSLVLRFTNGSSDIYSITGVQRNESDTIYPEHTDNNKGRGEKGSHKPWYSDQRSRSLWRGRDRLVRSRWKPWRSNTNSSASFSSKLSTKGCNINTHTLRWNKDPKSGFRKIDLYFAVRTRSKQWAWYRINFQQGINKPSPFIPTLKVSTPNVEVVILLSSRAIALCRESVS